jgi:hypothetical protein
MLTRKTILDCFTKMETVFLKTMPKHIFGSALRQQKRLTIQ